MVYVCALRIKEVISFPQEKKDHIYLAMMQIWRQNLWTVVTVRSSRAKLGIMVVIIGVGWWDCMSKNLPLSITVCIGRDIKGYERDGGRHFMSINRDLG